MSEVWDEVVVGEGNGFSLAVICSQGKPSKWRILIDTAGGTHILMM